MTDDNERKERSPLLPLRHERDFFVCDIFDAVPKSDMASMEHPLFTLSTKPDMTPRRYESGDNWLELRPSYLGLATVFDRDILIYCISQCMAALKEGRRVHRTLRFSAHDLLIATNRSTSDKGYQGFLNALERLRSTSVKTNIKMGGEEVLKGFGFIDSYEVVKETRDGRMQAIEVTLSDWIFSAINEKGKDLLTISPQFFQLRKPLEKRIYELARKHCGQNSKWSFKMETLRKRTGSTSTLKEFRRMVKTIVDMNMKENHIPDYTFEIVGDTFHIRPRADFTTAFVSDEKPRAIDKIILKETGLSNARKVSGGYDIYFLEAEWRAMLHRKNSIPDNPEGSFIGFVKGYVKNHGAAR